MAARRGLAQVLPGLVTAGVLAYGGLLLVLFLAQERLIFLPQPLAEAERARIARELPAAEELLLETPDGVRLRGWLVRAAGAGRAPLLIYFGGNAEEVSWLVGDPLWPPGWTVALVNYRGYGASGGRPSERALAADALLLHDRLRARPDVDPARVVAFGRSLGSGVAVQLAAARPLAGVILVSPYDSLRALAAELYPWVPVRWLLRHPFDSLALAPRIEAPLLAITAGADRIIPERRSRPLIEAWGGPRRRVRIPAAGHDDLALDPAYREAIRAFLAGLAPPSAAPR